jgi:hypothetical protein
MLFELLRVCGGKFAQSEALQAIKVWANQHFLHGCSGVSLLDDGISSFANIPQLAMETVMKKADTCKR